MVSDGGEDLTLADPFVESIHHRPDPNSTSFFLDLLHSPHFLIFLTSSLLILPVCTAVGLNIDLVQRNSTVLPTTIHRSSLSPNK